MIPHRRHEKKTAAWLGLRRYRFGILLAALLGMLVYAPLIELVAPQLPPIATEISLGIIFFWLTLSAVYAVSEHRRAPLVALALGILLLVAELGAPVLRRPEADILSDALGILFMSHIVIVLLRSIFHRTRVDTDTVFASLCIYLLLGFAWAFVYSLLEQVQPGAFYYALADEQQMRFGTEGDSLAIYFSFVTMTTLGYGDIAPVSAAARALSTLEAIFGQFYLTVLVAWLVGLHIAHSRSSASDTDT